jgi:Putative zinc- or iron-chelating domain
MPDERSPVAPVTGELVDELTALAEQLAARDDHADLAARLEWLIDALILRGQLPASFRRLADKVKGQGDRSVVRLATFRDKYALASADIDCAARIPLCGARCCSFDVTLSAQDVAERIVPFDVMRPYALPRENGRCVCMDEGGACTVYEHRPGSCRAYDCRSDPRVWIDFAARIPAPRT